MVRAAATPETCYACNSLGTSREHAPPLCVFPESADVDDGDDYRKNLWRVWSCDEHNLEKSADDEYMFHVLASNITSNAHGLGQVTTKVRRAVLRALERQGHAPISAAMSASQEVRVRDSATGTIHEAAMAPLEPRFLRSLELTALALHRHHYRLNWPGGVVVWPDFVDYPDAENKPELDRFRQALYEQATREFATAERLGANPNVFWYSVRESLVPPGRLMRLAFYGGATVTAYFDVKSPTRNSAA